jgi:hypothetical protein
MRFFGLFFACMDSFGFKVNQSRFLNFNIVPSIIDNYLKF